MRDLLLVNSEYDSSVVGFVGFCVGLFKYEIVWVVI